MKEVVLGVDLGTSAVHAVAVSVAGRVVAEAINTYPLSSPQPGWCEQNVDDWLSATVSVIREVAGSVGGSRVVGIGLSGQMNGLVASGAEGASLRPAILWNDHRSEEVIHEIASRVPASEVLERTGNALGPMFFLAKLFWLKNREPDLFKRMRNAFLPKDYLGFMLTGRMSAYAELTDASGTNLLNLERRVWDERIAGELGIPEDILPPLVPSNSRVGSLDPVLAEEMGLERGVPVIAGAGDNCASAVSSEVVPSTAGRACLSLGTSGVLLVASKDRVAGAPDALYTFLHPVDGFVILGSSDNCGGTINWLREVLLPGEGFDAIDALARDSRAGAGGTVFLPHASGGTCTDYASFGSWRSINPRTTAGELSRAVVESVAFDIADIADRLGSHMELHEIRVTGGASRLSILVEVLGALIPGRLLAANSAHGAAAGAAWLALDWLGVDLSTLQSAIEWHSVPRGEIPVEETRKAFERRRGIHSPERCA